jgi:hypothetical protein
MKKQQHSKLVTRAEKQALLASQLEAFRSINLEHIKAEITTLLELIGRAGIFLNYTKHDIGHINEMLRLLDWLIPEETKLAMSPGDWLMTVLAVYFHDLGMVVTNAEFDKRDLSDFDKFKRDVLFSGERADDYRQRVSLLSDAAAEHFYYEEFVRYHHAARIDYWLSGKLPAALGIAPELVEEISKLLGQIPPPVSFGPGYGLPQSPPRRH